MVPTPLRIVAVLLLALVLGGCQTNGETGGVDAARVDDTTVASVQKPYFIEFRSRYALSYGHSFVVFGRMDAGHKVLSQEIAGLAPASEDPNVYVAGHVVPVPSSTGATDGDNDKRFMTAFWRVRLTQAQYTKVVSTIRKLQKTHPTWTAIGYNCNAFTNDVAASLGYKKSFHLLRPREFIDSLRKKNAKPGDVSWTSPTHKPSGKYPNI